MPDEKKPLDINKLRTVLSVATLIYDLASTYNNAGTYVDANGRRRNYQGQFARRPLWR